MDQSPHINYFAQTDFRGRKIPFGIKSEDRAKHIYIIGKTGMAKSTMLENMAIQDIKNGEVLDVIKNPVGFRWFRFDANEGFFLNGKPYKLIGASRHQDYQGMGNAVPDEIAIRDVELIKEMGGN